MILRHVRFTVLITSVTTASVLAQSDAPVRFEVTSVKPGVADAATSFGIRPGGVFWADNVPLALLIGLAHEMNHDYLIVGGPAWIREAKYVVLAKAPAGVTMGPLVTGGKRSPGSLHRYGCGGTFAIRYRRVSDRRYNDPFDTAIDARVLPSSRLSASRRNDLPGAITVVTPSSLWK